MRAYSTFQVVFLTKELVPSPRLENLIHVTSEIADQRAPALRDEVNRLSTGHDEISSPGIQPGYSLKAAFEKRKAASLERSRLKTLGGILHRDLERIAALTDQVSAYGE